jgi:hypothetical protein
LVVHRRWCPFVVCGKIDIPWHEATDWHTLRLELVDFDG